MSAMDVFRKAFLAGLGALSLSREKAQKLVRELVKAGELRESEGRDLLDDLAKKAGVVKQEVEKTISQQMDAAYKRLNLVSLGQLKKMERRIHDLEQELAKAAKPAKKNAKRAGRK
jgi:polyhydroxyalkanoate synthesis regulator phasin